MADLVTVTYLDGTSEIVTLAEANYYKANNMLEVPPVVTDQLTLEDVYGEGYDERYKR